MGVLLGLVIAVALAACGRAEPAPMPAPPAMETADHAPAASPADAALTPAATATPTPAPVVMRYGAPDPTGAVDEPGDYAFFAADGRAITTHEGLRGDAVRLVIHERDADGESRAAFYDTVEAGDHFEWREAEDCWVRYLVDGTLPPDMSSRAFAVRRYAYAWTGCSGGIGVTDGHTWTWPPPNLRSPFSVPVRHGPWLLLPEGGWNGVLEEPVQVRPLPRDGANSADAGSTEWPPQPLPEPRLPEGWTGGVGLSSHGYVEGYYADDEGYLAVVITILLRYYLPAHEYTGPGTGQGAYVHETRIVDGRPALLWYLAEPRQQTSTGVSIFDAASGIEYVTEGYADHLRNDVEATLEIARTLLPDAP